MMFTKREIETIDRALIVLEKHYNTITSSPLFEDNYDIVKLAGEEKRETISVRQKLLDYMFQQKMIT
jgi:hypothetical protein